MTRCPLDRQGAIAVPAASRAVTATTTHMASDFGICCAGPKGLATANRPRQACRGRCMVRERTMEVPKSARAAARAVWRRMRRAACLCASLRCTSSWPTYSRTCEVDGRIACENIFQLKSYTTHGVIRQSAAFQCCPYGNGLIVSRLHAATQGRACPACTLCSCGGTAAAAPRMQPATARQISCSSCMSGSVRHRPVPRGTLRNACGAAAPNRNRLDGILELW